MAPQSTYTPYYPSSSPASGPLMGDYYRNQLLLQMMIAKEQEAAAQSQQAPNVKDMVMDIGKGEIRRQGLNYAKDAIFGSGGVASNTAGIGNASYNIPASYLPTVNPTGGAEIIGTMADGSPMTAASSAANSTAGMSGAQVLGSNISSGLQSVGMGAQTAGQVGSALGYGIPIAGGLYGAYNTIKGLESRRKMGTMGGAANGAMMGAAVGSVIPVIGTGVGALVGGAAGALLGQVGNSHKYFEAKDRNTFAKNLNKKYGTKYDPKIFEDDPGSYTYDQSSPGKNRELGAGQALAYLAGAGPVGSKMFTDMSGRFANDVKAGKDPTQMFKDIGLDYNSAMSALGSDSGLSAEHRAALQNGLNESIKPGMIPRATAPKDPTANIFGTGNTMAQPNTSGMINYFKPAEMQNGLGQTGNNGNTATWTSPTMIPKVGLRSGDKMRNGKTYISPGVYR